MKRLLLILGLAVGLQYSHAQKSAYADLPDRLFVQGKEMFLNNNYVGTINTLQEFRKSSKDPKLDQEADYMILASRFYQGTKGVENSLKDYLEQYPETYHRNQIAFFIGTVHFAEKDWKKAIYWFNQSDMDYLTENEQEDYAYRTAFANLQVGNKNDAKRLFGILSRSSKKYAEPASYYLAYIDFQNGEYDTALPLFRKLKNKSEYKENAAFFLTQGEYLSGNIQNTITEGRDFISTYPNSNNLPEIYRLLGSSYYRIGDLTNSIASYEQFLKSGKEPFRDDMYQLGEAYYQRAQYTHAIDALKKVASSTDQLGQAANLLLGQSYIKINDSANALLAFDSAARATYNKTISEDALYNYVVLTNNASVSVFSQSIASAQRFLTEYPNSKYTNEVNSVLATTLLSTKDYTAALTAINSIKSPGKQVLEAKQMILFQQGAQQFINGKYDAAINDFNASINMGSYNTDARNEAYFWRGETSYRQGAYSQAAKDYATYVSMASPSKSNYTLALYNLGYANFKEKQYSTALGNFRKYLSAEVNRQSPNYADALNRVGDCYLFNRNFSEAERYYSQAVDVNPSNADYSEFQKAFVLGLQRNYAGKITALNSMMSKYPNSPYYADALFEKSRALVMLNRESEAITVLEKLAKDYPKSSLGAQGGVQLGQLYFNTNNPQKSIEAYKRVISDYPNTEEARISLQSLEGVYKDINDIGSYASYANSLGGGMSLSTGRQDSLTYLAAENVFMKGRKVEAKAALDKYLKAYPEGVFSSDANFYLGSMSYDAKDYTSALDHFKEVINSNNPKYIDNALIYASGIEFDNENYQAAYGAYEHLNIVASTSENKGIAQLGMLRCAYLLNKDAEVVSAAKNILDNTKTSPDIANEARFYRAKALKKLNRIDDAIKDLQIVGKDARNVFGAESQYLLAETYYEQRAYDKTEKQIVDFMKQGTPHEYWLARGVIVLSDAYTAKGDKFQARQYLESLKANYKGAESDISQMIDERLSALN